MIDHTPNSQRDAKLLIRLAKPTDTAAIKRVAASLGYSSYSDAIAQARLKALLDSPNDHVWVCEQQGKLIGWIHAFAAHRLASDSFVEIGGLAVASNFRRLGAGAALVQQASQWAFELGLGLRVRSRIDREQASHFYCAQGFTLGKQQQVFELSTPDPESDPA